MAKVGNIYVDDKFTFFDGESKRKWFIVLNTPRENEPFIVALTTSKVEKFKNIESGCNEHYRNFLIDESFDDIKNFKCNTVIKFDRLYDLSYAEMLSKKFKNNLKLLGTLDRATVTLIMSCLRTFKYDIESEYQKILFK